ncbi:MAG: adenosine kinase [Candidatus Liptonbacteria bacterium]|nr:adenosine kinase [Candidatus Liptonbacteria bacterium]
MFDVLTLGTATRDVFLTSPLFKIVRDPEHLERLGFPTGEAQCFALGGKLEVGKPILTIGGGAANSAITFARQGLKAAALIKIGDDDNGQAVLNDFKKEGVTAIAHRDKETGTAYSVILLSPSGERTILNYRGASEFLKKADIAFSKIKSRWAYVSPGRIHLEVIQTLLRNLKKNRTLVAMNPSKYYIQLGLKRFKPILDKLDVVIMNREEASYLTRIKYEDEKRIFKKFDELANCLAIMTEGSKGVLVSDGKTVYKAGTYKEKRVVDRTGAGDAFGSGFVASLALSSKKKDYHSCMYDPSVIESAIKLGSANAASVVEKIGAEAGILTKKEFEKEYRFKNLPIHLEHLL